MTNGELSDSVYHIGQIVSLADDPSLALLLSYNLQNKGYHTIQFDTGEDFLNQIDPETAHLIIISVQLSDIDGLKLCENIRDAGISIPILFLTTSLNQESCSCVDRIDMLRKPFSISELLHKVSELLND